LGGLYAAGDVAPMAAFRRATSCIYSGGDCSCDSDSYTFGTRCTGSNDACQVECDDQSETCNDECSAARDECNDRCVELGSGDCVCDCNAAVRDCRVGCDQAKGSCSCQCDPPVSETAPPPARAPQTLAHSPQTKSAATSSKTTGHGVSRYMYWMAVLATVAAIHG
jgi:hypothetical protein